MGQQARQGALQRRARRCHQRGTSGPSRPYRIASKPEAEPCELPPLHHWDDEPVAADEERYAIPGEDKKPDAEDTAMAAEFIDDEWSENDDDSDDDDDVEIWIE